MSVSFSVIGLDHGHVHDMVQGLLDAGARLHAACPSPSTAGADLSAEFRLRHPSCTWAFDEAALLANPQIQLVVLAGVPAERAGAALRALAAGKHVLSDKPLALTQPDLNALRDAQAASGLQCAIFFGERMGSRAATQALELLRGGRIGKLVCIEAFGPHSHNEARRPAWFHDIARNGGILADIGSHMVDQFLAFTDSDDAEVVWAHTANRGNPARPGFRDLGQMLLRAGGVNGYVRVDWFSPPGLPAWGDGRTLVVGTHGTLDLRKTLDVARPDDWEVVYVSDPHGLERIDCSALPLPFFTRFVEDIRSGSFVAAPPRRVLRAMELALQAQAMADAGDTV